MSEKKRQHYIELIVTEIQAPKYSIPEGLDCFVFRQKKERVFVVGRYFEKSKNLEPDWQTVIELIKTDYELETYLILGTGLRI